MRFDLEKEIADCNDNMKQFVTDTYHEIVKSRDQFLRRQKSTPVMNAEYLREDLIRTARSYERRAYDIGWDKPNNWEDGRPVGFGAMERLCRSHASWCRRMDERLHFAVCAAIGITPYRKTTKASHKG